MSASYRLTTVDDLEPALIEAWRSIQRSDSRFESPYFCPEFTQLVGGVQSLDTRLMRSLSGWVAKGGAEGVGQSTTRAVVLRLPRGDCGNGQRLERERAHARCKALGVDFRSPGRPLRKVRPLREGARDVTADRLEPRDGSVPARARRPSVGVCPEGAQDGARGR